MKKVLILNGSHSEATVIEKAKELGYYVVTTGNNPSLMGHQFADEYIPMDYSDKEAILKLVQENGIDRIISCANDFGVITSAYVAEKMGWPGHDTYENAKRLHLKDQFKNYIQELGLPCPHSVAFTDREEAVVYAKNAEYPIIVKANDLTGGKGILRADNFEEAIVAIDNAFTRSREKHIVIEPYIIGVQQSMVAFVKDRRVLSSISNNVYCPINPYLIQSETMPALDIDQVEKKVHDMIAQICDDLNLVDGMFTFQYIVKDGVPYIIEMMRRCLGNQYLTVAHAITGFPWEEALVRAETGMDLNNLQWEKPIAKYAGHHGIMTTRNGVVNGYTVDPEVEKHLFKKIDILKPGESINDFMNERVAYIYYRYDDHMEMVNTVSRMNDLIHIDFAD